MAGTNPTVTEGGVPIPSAASAASASDGGADLSWPTSPSVSYIEVAEADGAPDVLGVQKLIVSNGSLTDNADGSVTIITSGMANPMTTAGDLIVGGTAGAPARLAKGSDLQVLTVDPATHLIAWAASGGGGSQQHVLLADGHATPFAFTDLLQMDDGSDLMWSDS